jgi:hypothetical protein
MHFVSRTLFGQRPFDLTNAEAVGKVLDSHGLAVIRSLVGPIARARLRMASLTNEYYVY